MIEAVRDNEELYNQGHRLYFDTSHKNKIWMETATKINKTGMYLN